MKKYTCRILPNGVVELSVLFLSSRMKFYHCPMLPSRVVELSDEREHKIERFHADLYNPYPEKIGETIRFPDSIQVSAKDPEARLLTKWHDEVSKYVIVKIVQHPSRNWVITAHFAGNKQKGEYLWKRS